MSKTIQYDQFYTHPEEVEKCLNLLSQYYDMNSYDCVFEPAAGTGAFYKKFPKDKAVGWDIEPACDGVIQQDFYTSSYNFPPNTITISNPPFGRKASDAFRFMNICCGFSKVVAMVLPRIFMKHTSLNRIDRHFHLIDSCDVTKFVLPDGEIRNVSCVFQIWEKRNYLRELIVKPSYHRDFELLHRHLSRTPPDELAMIRNTYDFSIGQNSGKIHDPKTVVAGSHWFVKLRDKNDRKYFEMIDYHRIDDHYTTHLSLSKKDIIEQYTKNKNETNNSTTLENFFG
jgi:hypothetical protein